MTRRRRMLNWWVDKQLLAALGVVVALHPETWIELLERWRVQRGPLITRHHCRVTRGHLVVDSAWYGDYGGADLHGSLAHPLPPRAQLRHISVKPIQMRLRMSLRHWEGGLPLPLPAKPGVHRVEIDASLAFVPARTLGFQPRPSGQATREVHPHQCHAIDRVLRGSPPRDAYYFTSRTIQHTNELPGTLTLG